MAADIQLNHFELELLEYIYRNPGVTSQVALEKTHVDRGSGQIAVRYLARRGLISLGTGDYADKKITATGPGIELLMKNGFLDKPSHETKR